MPSLVMSDFSLLQWEVGWLFRRYAIYATATSSCVAGSLSAALTAQSSWWPMMLIAASQWPTAPWATLAGPSGRPSSE